MAGFSGFTDEEIRCFKIQSEVVDHHGESRDAVKKASLSRSGKRNKPREKIRTKQGSSKNNVPKYDGSTSPTTVDKTNSKSNSKGKTEKPVEKKDVEDMKIVEKPREIEVIMEPERVKEKEMSNLEKMQQKQKEMEMINKKKEKMLQYTLKQRYQKTQKETETLKMVQKELSHLDHLLYADVQLLRDKIDEACREYDYAQKRYQRAETEFINSKVNLHEKSETKDQLTEHLCAIIQENEERKAKKLAELMTKLEIADQDLKEPLSPVEEKPMEDSVVKNKGNVNETTEEKDKKSPQIQDKSSSVQDKPLLEQSKSVEEKSSSSSNEQPSPPEKKTAELAENVKHPVVNTNNNSIPAKIQDSSNDNKVADGLTAKTIASLPASTDKELLDQN